jgi:UDP-glucose 4-epimerase
MEGRMIVVIGAGGFIGTYLVDALMAEGLDVVAVDVNDVAREHYASQGVSFVRMDITRPGDFDQLPSAGVDAVVDVACLQPVDVSEEAYEASEYIRVNVIGTLNILEYCRRSGAGKVIYTISHRGVQGLWDRGEVITEEATKALKFTGEYTMFSISECAAVDCVWHYAAAYGLQGVVLRLPPVFGYGPHLEGYREGKPVKAGFAVFIDRAIKGQTIELWGDVESSRDIVYVKDVVSAIGLALAKEEASGLYNIASGVQASLRQEAEEIARVFSPEANRSPIVFRPELPNAVEPFAYDITKAGRELGWFPRYHLREMFEDIKEEMASGRFDYLVEKRVRMMDGGRDSTIGWKQPEQEGR